MHLILWKWLCESNRFCESDAGHLAGGAAGFAITDICFTVSTTVGGVRIMQQLNRHRWGFCLSTIANGCAVYAHKRRCTDDASFAVTNSRAMRDLAKCWTSFLITVGVSGVYSTNRPDYKDRSRWSNSVVDWVASSSVQVAMQFATSPQEQANVRFLFKATPFVQFLYLTRNEIVSTSSVSGRFQRLWLCFHSFSIRFIFYSIQ